MAAFDLITFLDIQNAVINELKIQTGDTVALNRVKRDINMSYRELTSRTKWTWLRKHTTLQHPAVINAGTITVTQNSTDITFSTAPGIPLEGYQFSVDGQSDIHIIETHVAASTSATLRTSYNGATSTTATYKAWTTFCPLPVDCQDVIQIIQYFRNTPLERKDIMSLREIEVMAPLAENRPIYYAIGDYREVQSYDAITSMPASVTRSSSGLLRTIVFSAAVPSTVVANLNIRITLAENNDYEGEFVIASVSTTTVTNDTITYVGSKSIQESSTADTGINVKALGTKKRSEMFRELHLYPAIHTSNTLLNVDYTKHIVGLENDTDEPLIPPEDRIVLVYGALQRAWTRERNPEESARNLQMFERKANKMEGKIVGGNDPARLVVNKLYLGQLRNASRQKGLSPHETAFGGAGSSGQVVTGTANQVATFGADGNLIASVGVSTTELDQLDGILSKAVGVSDTQTLSNKDLVDNSTSIVDNTDSTIKIEFDAAGTTGTKTTLTGSQTTNRVLTLPDITDTLVTKTSTDVLTNKKLVDSSTEIVDNGDNTKVIKFDAAGTTATSTTLTGSQTANRVLTLPDATDTLVGKATTDSLTNKSIDADGTGNSITNIENADIKAAAAIAVNKLAALTATQIVTSDSSGFLETTAITPTELTYLKDVVPLTTVALADNQSSVADIFTYSASSFEFSIIEFSIARGAGNRSMGQIMVATDQSTVNITEVTSQLGTIGVTITADINSGNVRLRYTSTNTGTAPTFKYIQRRWT